MIFKIKFHASPIRIITDFRNFGEAYYRIRKMVSPCRIEMCGFRKNRMSLSEKTFPVEAAKPDECKSNPAKITFSNNPRIKML